MTDRPTFVMTDAAHFAVSYQINPWMQPDAWLADPSAQRARAIRSSEALQTAIASTGATIELIPAEPGLPDLVFPANSAVVLDRTALMARFRHSQRQGEEPVLRLFFDSLVERGLLDRIVTLPDGVWQEGAGDAIWDGQRQHFWVGHSQRSSQSATTEIQAVFGRRVVELELVSPRFYHLDTCFCPLSGGDLLYYPAAFSAAALTAIYDHAGPEQLIEATDEDAAAFCLNAVNVGNRIIMSHPSQRLRTRLSERGYEIVEVNLDPFILAGGAAYCMTLRLDRTGLVRVDSRLSSPSRHQPSC